MRKSLPALVCASLLLAACASYSGSGLKPGASEAQVRAAMGEPAAVHPAPAGADYARSLEYPRGPAGRQTFMARLDTLGRLLRVDQVLDEKNIPRIRVGVDGMEEVRTLLGRPGRQAVINRYYGGPTWDYFAEDIGRHIIISVTFDRAGKVAAAGSMIDPDEQTTRRGG